MSRYYSKKEVDAILIKQFANGDLLGAVRSLPTIEVSEDCISRADLPKMLNGVVLDDCDQIVDEFLEEHKCDELWNTVRALRDFYEWTIDAPSVVPKDNGFKDGQKDMLMFLLEGMKNALEQAIKERTEE